MANLHNKIWSYTPSLCPFSFIFMQFSANFEQIIVWCPLLYWYPLLGNPGSVADRFHASFPVPYPANGSATGLNGVARSTDNKYIFKTDQIQFLALIMIQNNFHFEKKTDFITININTFLRVHQEMIDLY